MTAVIDAIEWLDVSLVERFMYGFPVVGYIPDSGVYRPIEPRPEPAFGAALSFFNRSTYAWNSRLFFRLESRQWASADAQAARGG